MNDKNKISKNTTIENSNKAYPANVTYSPSEDIYSKDKEETEIDPEDISKTKATNENDGKYNGLRGGRARRGATWGTLDVAH